MEYLSSKLLFLCRKGPYLAGRFLYLHYEYLPLLSTKHEIVSGSGYLEQYFLPIIFLSLFAYHYSWYLVLTSCGYENHDHFVIGLGFTVSRLSSICYRSCVCFFLCYYNWRRYSSDDFPHNASPTTIFFYSSGYSAFKSSIFSCVRVSTSLA